MADLARVRCAWTGVAGGPGVSTFYLDPGYPTGSIGAIRTFFNALVSLLPNTVSIQVPGSGDIIQDSTGALVGTWSDTLPAVVTGSSASGYAAPAGMMVRWNTSAIVGTHRLRGRTFLVPFVNAYEPNGSPNAATITILQNAANALIAATSPALMVWSRPFTPTPPATTPEAREGSSSEVDSATIPDKSVVLRSRRD